MERANRLNDLVEIACAATGEDRRVVTRRVLERLAHGNAITRITRQYWADVASLAFEAQGRLEPSTWFEMAHWAWASGDRDTFLHGQRNGQRKQRPIPGPPPNKFWCCDNCGAVCNHGTVCGCTRSENAGRVSS